MTPPRMKMRAKGITVHLDLIVKLKLSQRLRGLKLKDPRKRELGHRSCQQRRHNTTWQADSDRKSWRVTM